MDIFMQKNIRSVPFYSLNPLSLENVRKREQKRMTVPKRADKKNGATAYAPTETGSLRSPTALTAHGIMAT